MELWNIPECGLNLSLPNLLDLGAYQHPVKHSRTEGVHKLECYAVLSYIVMTRLPYQRDIAGMCGLQPPRQKCRNRITSDCRTVSTTHNTKHKDNNAPDSIRNRGETGAIFE